MGKHEKDKNDTAAATRRPGLDYDQTGGGKHRPAPILKSGHLGTRGDGDGKSTGLGWGDDRSARP